jgi:isopenicillin-N epimerase
MSALSPRSAFLLDPDVHFLNHGSFGACPLSVFDEYQRWQKALERQPVELLGRRFVELLRQSRKALAGFLDCAAEDLVYFHNPTTAINMVARSLGLGPDDEILASNHEYGAMDRIWRFIASKTGARYVNQPIPVPFQDSSEVLDQFWRGATARTRVVFISHIASQTALTFPVAEICREARARGIVSIVDGAHVPGQSPLSLRELLPDIYAGACHKWLCAPKGAAFLYVAKHLQPQMDPLVVSWGFQSETPGESQFLDYHQWQGTNDISAFLTVPAALQRVSDPDWQRQLGECRQKAAAWWRRLQSEFGLAPLSSDASWFRQMFALQLPVTAPEPLKSRLYDDFKVEVPVYSWEGNIYLRVSVHIYNTEDDFEALCAGLHALLH